MGGGISGCINSQWKCRDKHWKQNSVRESKDRRAWNWPENQGMGLKIKRPNYGLSIDGRILRHAEGKTEQAFEGQALCTEQRSGG